MKKSFFIASFCAIALTLAAGYDSGERKQDPNKPTIQNDTLATFLYENIGEHGSVSIVSPYLVAEILSPGLESNFNRLVVFPELGKYGEQSGFDSVIRGPPKILC